MVPLFYRFACPCHFVLPQRVVPAHEWCLIAQVGKVEDVAEPIDHPGPAVVRERFYGWRYVLGHAWRRDKGCSPFNRVQVPTFHMQYYYCFRHMVVDLPARRAEPPIRLALERLTRVAGAQDIPELKPAQRTVRVGER